MEVFCSCKIEGYGALTWAEHLKSQLPSRLSRQRARMRLTFSTLIYSDDGCSFCLCYSGKRIHLVSCSVVWKGSGCFFNFSMQIWHFSGHGLAHMMVLGWMVDLMILQSFSTLMVLLYDSIDATHGMNCLDPNSATFTDTGTASGIKPWFCTYLQEHSNLFLQTVSQLETRLPQIFGEELF